MANGLFIPDFRGAGTPGAPGVGSTRRGLETARQAEQITEIQQVGLQGTRDKARIDSIVRGAILLKQIGDPQQKLEFLRGRVQQLDENKIPSNDTRELLRIAESGDFAQVEELTDLAISSSQEQTKKQAVPAGIQEFESLTKNLTGEDLDKARRIKLGLDSAAPKIFQSSAKTFDIGGVPHILDAEGKVRKIVVDGNDITTEVVAESKAEIAQQVKFASATGASRAKLIDQGFEKITKITAGIANIDRAIGVIKGGAGVGAIERFFPSFKATSVELDNIRKSMGLDVVGGVTFGALSKGELNLALDVALPIGLDSDELIIFLEKKKIAQEKLRNYFSEQIQFVDQGGTIAGFLRKKESEQGQATPAPTPAEQELTEGTFIVNPQTGQRLQLVNGQFVEVQ